MGRLAGGAPSLLDAVRGVHWPARRISGGAIHGAHPSKRAGASPEFSEYRPYQQGDDPARIDWKLFGRTERVAIRLARDDSRLPTTVLLDASASMAYPPASLDKWELAAAVALGLAAVAHGDGDPIGFATPPPGSVVPPRTRRGTVGHILQLLLQTAPAGRAPLAPLLATLRSSRRIAIVSDFLGDADELLEQARELAAGGREIYAIHVVAREELDPTPPPRQTVVTDPEDPSIRRALDKSAIPLYQDAFARWRESLAVAWRGAGAVYALATTGEAPERVVRRVVRS